ncbi:hypothetical protein CCMSSC00406_0002256 [Pleurotus cornucopiae]|uniref:Uncharacterized protein n=1 Tax=Pleurotus cornucopiae TaxID=5321 RepID=A0ACB7J5F0_PLECO|nr:hypothetical protein CCMSSC00406_0002256 [Pleurotus cornucopiae]
MFTASSKATSSSSKKSFLTRIFKNAHPTQPVYVEESSKRRKVSKHQIKLLYVDCTKRDEPENQVWTRCERRVVSKDLISLVGVDCTKRMEADAGVESDSEGSESATETCVGDDEDDDASVYSMESYVEVESDVKQLEDGGELAAAEASFWTVPIRSAGRLGFKLASGNGMLAQGELHVSRTLATQAATVPDMPFGLAK